MTTLPTFEGGCHCGAVRFTVQVERFEGLSCNCSICMKKGFLHLIVPTDRFELLQGEEMLTTYRFNTKVARHLFCKVCGIHAFYNPRSHPNCIDVNIRCLEGTTPSRFTIKPFDGRNWEENVEEIQGETS